MTIQPYEPLPSIEMRAISNLERIPNQGLRYGHIHERILPTITKLFYHKSPYHEKYLRIQQLQEPLPSIYTKFWLPIIGSSVNVVSILMSVAITDFPWLCFSVGGLGLCFLGAYCIAILVNNISLDRLALQTRASAIKWLDENDQELIDAHDLKNIFHELDEDDLVLLNKDQIFKGYPDSWKCMTTLLDGGKLSERQKAFVEWIQAYRHLNLHLPTQREVVLKYLDQRNFRNLAKRYPEILEAIVKDHPHPSAHEKINRLKKIFGIPVDNLEEGDTILEINAEDIQNEPFPIAALPPTTSDQPKIYSATSCSIHIVLNEGLTPENFIANYTAASQSQNLEILEKSLYFIANHIDELDLSVLPDIPHPYRNLDSEEFSDRFLIQILYLFKDKYESTPNKSLFLKNIAHFCRHFNINSEGQPMPWIMSDKIPVSASLVDYAYYITLMEKLTAMTASDYVDVTFSDGSKIEGINRTRLMKKSPIFKQLMIQNPSQSIVIQEESRDILLPLLDTIQHGERHLTKENFPQVFTTASQYLIESVITMCAKFFADHIDDKEMDFSYSIISDRNFPAPRWDDPSYRALLSDIFLSLTNKILSSSDPKHIFDKAIHFFTCFGISMGYMTLYEKLVSIITHVIDNEYTFELHHYYVSLVEILENEQRSLLEEKLNLKLFNALKSSLPAAWESAVSQDNVKLKTVIAQFCLTEQGKECLAVAKSENVHWLVPPDDLTSYIKPIAYKDEI